MLLSDFSIQKGKFAGTELPVIEKESHTYKTRGKNVRKQTRSHLERLLQDKRMSTARRVLDEGWNSDNALLAPNDSLQIPIQPYLDHYLKSGWQVKPEGRGWHSSEKNDDRRTRAGWVYDLIGKQNKEKRSRSALKAVQRALWFNRVDPMTHSHGNTYKKLSGVPYGPGEG